MFFLWLSVVFFSMTPQLPRSTLFPYTTLFRSLVIQTANAEVDRTEALRLGLLHAGLYVVLSVTEGGRSEEHTSELQSLTNLVCRLLLEKKNEEDRYDFRAAERQPKMPRLRRLS